MKRTTAAAATAVTALVLAGGGAGVAMAYDHHPSYPSRNPVATVQAHPTQPVAATTARPATQTHQQHATVHPAAVHPIAGHAPAAVQQHRTVTPQRSTTQTRAAVPQRVHHSDSWQHCDGWDNGSWDHHR